MLIVRLAGPGLRQAASHIRHRTCLPCRSPSHNARQAPLSGLPHSLQNLRSARFSVPQTRQVNEASRDFRQVTDAGYFGSAARSDRVSRASVSGSGGHAPVEPNRPGPLPRAAHQGTLRGCRIGCRGLGRSLEVRVNERRRTVMEERDAARSDAKQLRATVREMMGRASEQAKTIEELERKIADVIAANAEQASRLAGAERSAEQAGSAASKLADARDDLKNKLAADKAKLKEATEQVVTLKRRSARSTSSEVLEGQVAATDLPVFLPAEKVGELLGDRHPVRCRRPADHRWRCAAHRGVRRRREWGSLRNRINRGREERPTTPHGRSETWSPATSLRRGSRRVNQAGKPAKEKAHRGKVSRTRQSDLVTRLVRQTGSLTRGLGNPCLPRCSVDGGAGLPGIPVLACNCHLRTPDARISRSPGDGSTHAICACQG